MRAIVVLIVWYLDLKLPMQSVPITSKVVTSNPAHVEVYSIQHFVIKFVSYLWQDGGFLLAPVSQKVVGLSLRFTTVSQNLPTSGIRHFLVAN
jgi:hypothetical protein